MQDNTISLLVDSWLYVSRSYCSESETAAVYNMILSKYTEPHRKFHTAEHIVDLLHKLYPIIEKLPYSDSDAIILACFFHDYVYDPTSKTNEAESATHAEFILSGVGIPKDIVAQTVHLIQCTHHSATPSNSDTLANFFNDADFSIFGESPERYVQYVREISSEFNMYSPEEFKFGRQQFLQALLQKDRIFNTGHFHELYETQARHNIKWELDTIK